MKIFLLISNFPYSKGEAVEIVTFEVINKLVSFGHEVFVQSIIRDDLDPAYYEERKNKTVKQLQNKKIHFCDPIYFKNRINEKGIKKYFNFCVKIILSLPLLRRKNSELFFPAIKLFPLVRKSIIESKSDVIFSIWSWEAVAASYNITTVKKFIYYGNPDHCPQNARLKNPELFDINIKGIKNKLIFNLNKLFNKAIEVKHLNMMKKCETIANNSMYDSNYYRSKGHKNSVYMQNLWPKYDGEPIFLNKISYKRKVIGSVGRLYATGNTFGLNFIGNELALEFEEKFSNNPVIIEILGSGQPYTIIEQALKKKNIKLRGWVDDIINELKTSIAFLVFTNDDNFIVGNTRILLSWSIGLPVILDEKSILSMPEIEDGKNAVLVKTAKETADCVENFLNNEDYRLKIGKGGYDTFNEFYNSDRVVKLMIEEMKKLIG